MRNPQTLRYQASTQPPQLQEEALLLPHHTPPRTPLPRIPCLAHPPPIKTPLLPQTSRRQSAQPHRRLLPQLLHSAHPPLHQPQQEGRNLLRPVLALRLLQRPEDHQRHRHRPLLPRPRGDEPPQRLLGWQRAGGGAVPGLSG
ncbi:UNVERIFIED_CONTAM: hypothetical protein Sradi_1968600 [Sesamum radiatum]|uniref:Uncharacterized protein n=1 Tax=Sesamum radiatum TaxID=300843 RepID=A0AAW2TGH6_SESRA